MPNSGSGLIDVAVVGAGYMGSNHARILSRLKNCRLAAIVDVDYQKAQKLAQLYDCRAFGDIGDLPGKVVAAAVATPASTHALVGCYLLNHGIHCLVEKPMATTEEECQALIAAAKNNVLMVGHIERFNPAVQTLVDILPGEGRILAAEARRLSWVPGRADDVDVVMDLMIHDLDIVLGIMPSEMIALQAAAAGEHGSEPNHVTALCSFADGATATITSSKITHHKIRELAVTMEQCLFHLDFQRQELFVFRRGVEKAYPSRATTLDLVTERVFVRNGEPLWLELDHFIDCILTGKPVLASAQDALRALRGAWKIQAAFKRQEAPLALQTL